MKRLLVMGGHFIPSSLMRASIPAQVKEGLEIAEASTPFPREPFRDIAEVKQASGQRSR